MEIVSCGCSSTIDELGTYQTRVLIWRRKDGRCLDLFTVSLTRAHEEARNIWLPYYFFSYRFFSLLSFNVVCLSVRRRKATHPEKGSPGGWRPVKRRQEIPSPTGWHNLKTAAFSSLLFFYDLAWCAHKTVGEKKSHACEVKTDRMGGINREKKKSIKSAFLNVYI